MLTRASIIIRRQALLKSNAISQEIVTCRRIHVVAQGKATLKNNISLDLHRNYRVTGISSIRYASTNETPPSSSPYDEIPDPPTPIQEIVENIVKLHPNGEPTFQSLGLGGWSPPGMIQNVLEYMHISLDMPWWLTIVTATICIRSLMFPLVISARKNTIHLTTHMPIIQEMQLRLTQARNTGDYMESARVATELKVYLDKHSVKLVRNFLMPFIQAPVFISFFWALRGMANLPVESLKEGGFWWVTDLTVYDPYYILPIITSLTLFATIELGTEGVNIQTMGMMRYVLRAVPFVVLPFMLHFPGTVLTYWMSTNIISLIQTGVLKVPYIKKALNIPDMVKPAAVKAAQNKKGFVDEVKNSWTNLKITKQMSDRERADVIQFNAAGKGPIVKTFKYDPTKQKKTSTILTKSRE